MTIPTEPIGSIPRPPELLDAMASHERGEISDAELAAAQDKAVRDTISRFEQSGSPVVTDGEQSKPSFATYPIAGSRTWLPMASSSRSPTATNGSYPCWPAGLSVIRFTPPPI